jgi:hypothetical protein
MFFTGAVARPGPLRLEQLPAYAAIDALADGFDGAGRSPEIGAPSAPRVAREPDDLCTAPLTRSLSRPIRLDAHAMQQKFLTLARPVLNGRAELLADTICRWSASIASRRPQLGRR